MTDEDGFLRKLLDNPTDDTVRLVYADWLEEREDQDSVKKAEFLRRTCELAAKPENEVRSAESQLRKLATNLDADWLAVVSRPKVENCGGKRSGTPARSLPLIRFDFMCDRQWDEMQTTDDRRVRYCDSCRQTVHFSDTIEEARHHARAGHCVAVNQRVKRRKNDLVEYVVMAGVLALPEDEPPRREREEDRPAAE
jgi:uncharacterized protein (TIGR02996 family)